MAQRAKPTPRTWPRPTMIKPCCDSGSSRHKLKCVRRRTATLLLKRIPDAITCRVAVGTTFVGYVGKSGVRSTATYVAKTTPTSTIGWHHPRTRRRQPRIRRVGGRAGWPSHVRHVLPGAETRIRLGFVSLVIYRLLFGQKPLLG